MPRQQRSVLIVGASLLPASIIGGWLYYPYSTVGPTICFWRGVFGKNCLTCGMTRALCSFSRGNFAEAWNYHPFVFLLVALLCFASIRSVMKLVAGCRLEQAES